MNNKGDFQSSNQSIAANQEVEIRGDLIHGDKVDGDKNTVGDVSGKAVIAIGKGARNEINYYTEIIVKHDSIEEIPPVPGDPPYKGLTYFTEQDAKIFYGREDLSQHIISRLKQQHFLAIVGASGSGKSSLLRAGIVPHLRDQNWLVHVITPGSRPLEAVASSLGRDIDSLDFTPKLKKAMLHNSQTLYLLGSKFASRAEVPRLLLVVDQFEEVFTQCQNEKTRRMFVENLLMAANEKGPITIMIGLRADFYDRCAQYDGLRVLVSQQQELIGAMKQEELVRIIAKPARIGGWKFVEGLVEQILEDAGQEPGRLPLISHALRETWERRRGIVMTLAGYRAAGGVESAIAKTAENTLNQLEQQNEALGSVAKAIFLSLTELGEGAEDTRRVVSRAELDENSNSESIDYVMHKLIDARLITAQKGQIEVAHEALIRRWPRLRAWLADNRERLRFERQLTLDAKEWEALDKDSGSLYRGAKLQQAIEWSEKNDIHPIGLAARFLGASRQLAEQEARDKEAQRSRELDHQRALAEEQRKRAEDAERATISLKRRRNIAFGLAAIAALLAIAGFFLFGQAQSARTDAERQASLALSSRLVTEAQNVGNQELRLLLAIEAIRVTVDEGHAPNSDAVEELQQALSTGLDKALTTAAGEFESGRDVQFSPDGRFLALQRGSHSGTAKLINAQTTEIVTFPEPVTDIDYFEFGATGQYIAAGSVQNVHILKAQTLQIHCSIALPTYSDTRITLNFDESRLFTQPYSGAGQIWDTQTCESVGFVPSKAFDGQISDSFFVGSEKLFTIFGAGLDRTLTQWHLQESGSPIKVHDIEFDRMHISHNESRLAYTDEGFINVIDIAAGKTVFRHEFGENNAFRAILLSPKGNYLLTADFSKNTMQLWNLERGAIVNEFEVLFPGERLEGISTVTDGQTEWLVIWSDHQVELRNPETGNLLPSPPYFGGEQIIGLAIHPQKQEMLIGLNESDDGTIRLWDMAQNQEVARYEQKIGSFGSMAFSPDGKFIATAPTDGTLRLWATPSARPQSVSELSLFSGENSLQVLVENEKGELAAWDPINNDLNIIPLSECQQSTLRFSSIIDTRWLVTEHNNFENQTCEENGTFVWDLNLFPPKIIWFAPDAFLLSDFAYLPSISATGHWIANGGDMLLSDELFFADPEPYAMSVWNTINGQSFNMPHIEYPEYFALHPTDPLMATVDTGEQFNTVLLWQFDNGDVEPISTTLSLKDEMLGIFVNNLAFDPSGQKLFATYVGGPIRIWDVENKILEVEKSTVSNFSFSATGDIMAVNVISPTRRLEIWNTSTLSVIAGTDLFGIGEAALLELNAANNVVAITDRDGNVLVWNWTASNSFLIRLEHSEAVKEMAFTSDGRVLLTATEDGTIRTWFLEVDDLINAACNIVGRPLSDTEWNAYIGDFKESRPSCDQ